MHIPTAVLVAAASLAGVPLTAGFFGKFFAILLAVGAGQWLLVALAVIGAAAGFYYYFKVIRANVLERAGQGRAPARLFRTQPHHHHRTAAAILVLGL